MDQLGKTTPLIYLSVISKITLRRQCHTIGLGDFLRRFVFISIDNFDNIKNKNGFKKLNLRFKKLKFTH